MPRLTLISVVEDDRPFRDSMRKLLASFGYSVQDFPLAADFLASSVLAQTACLITDINMPGMTGLELHRHLVSLGHAIPTILVTAYPDAAVRAHALREGVLCYLPKPVDDLHLEECVRLALATGATRHGRS